MPPGQPSRLNGAHRAASPRYSRAPIPAVHGVVRWRIVDSCQWIFEEFRVVVAKQTLSRELRAMGYRKIFKSYDDVVDHCCEAWNNLVDQPWRIMSIGLRNWAHGS